MKLLCVYYSQYFVERQEKIFLLDRAGGYIIIEESAKSKVEKNRREYD